jgi:hypothetical protein
MHKKKVKSKNQGLQITFINKYRYHLLFTFYYIRMYNFFLFFSNFFQGSCLFFFHFLSSPQLKLKHTLKHKVSYLEPIDYADYLMLMIKQKAAHK